MKNSIFEKVLNQVSIDPRINDGTFRIDEDAHMDILREYFIKKGIDKSLVIEFCNKVVEGKYPERQAYNAKGILVTFPTPEYKTQAIKRGTHFEEDPTKRPSNVFADQPASKDPKPATAPQPKTDTKTSLPKSQAVSPDSQPEGPASSVTANPPTTTAAPQQSPEPPTEFSEPTELPKPIEKSPSEKEADKNLIKTMLKGDDYMLEQMCEWISWNGPDYLIERLKKYKKP
jgi:hypothetical protein